MPTIMEVCSNALRSMIVAPLDKKLVISDLSNIEGRKLAWLAGEEWKLQAFRDFDAGTGPDIYKLAYARAFRIGVDAVLKPQRQIGKVMELALGYQGGVGAFVTMAETYALDLDELADAAYDNLPHDARSYGLGMWEWAQQKKRTLGLPQKVYVVCSALVYLWRGAHPKIVALWNDLEVAMLTAVSYAPGSGAWDAGPHLTVDRAANWLRIRLPSGRSLCYPAPKAEGEKLSYAGTNPYTKQWGRVKTYGGKLAENATQAAARDVLAEGMFRAEAAGYRIVLTVHDELITETPDTDEYSAEKLSALLATNAPWNEGLPLAAAGAEGYRYAKE